MRKKIKNIIISPLVLCLSISCSGVNNLSGNNLTKTSGTLGSDFTSLDSNINPCESETGFSIKKTKEEIMAKMPGPDKARKIDIRNLKADEIPGFHPGKKLKNEYSNNRAIEEGLTEGNINIIFKDEYKVRYDKERKSFYSLNGSDVTNINSIISMLSFEEVIGRFDITEEQAEEREKRLEKNYGYDSVNQKSSYWLNGVKNTDIKTLIEKIRQNSLVRESNLDTGATPDYVPSTNDPIFVNSSTPFSGTDFVPRNESSRYYYSRIKAYEAWDIVNNMSQKPEKIAVIDFGFSTDNTLEDQPYYDLDNQISCTETSCTTGSNADVEYDSSDTATLHGIYVASVIGAPENGKGTVGLIAPKLAKNTTNPPSSDKLIVPVKISGNIRNSIPLAINEIVNNKNTNHVKVINISISLNNAPNTIPIENHVDILEAINDAYDVGILTVITAGNYGKPVPTNSISKALVVGGTAKNSNTRWIKNFTTPPEGSHYGARVDIAAPAEEIVLPTINNNYIANPGTSFAAPMVAATAALIMAMRPEYRDSTPLSVDRVKNLLVYSATPIQSDYILGKPIYSYAVSVPNGRMLNMYNALKLAQDMNPANNYARVYNTDFNSVATEFDRGGQTSYDQTDKYYKEDGIIDVTGGNKAVLFNTYNADCYYSWGYQVWKQGIIYFEEAAGLAGRYNPSGGNTVKNQWLDYSNTGISPSADAFVIIW